MIKVIYTNNERIVKDSTGKKIPIYEYIEYIDIRKEVAEFIRKLERQQVDGMSIEDIILYENIPLYIFLRPNFSKWISTVIEFVFVLQEITKKCNEIHVITDNEVFKRIAIENFNLNCDLIKNNINTPKKSLIDLNYLIRIFKGIKNYIKFILKNKFNKKKSILALTMAISIAESNEYNKKEKFYDSQYGELLNILEKDYNVFNFQLLHSDQEIKKANKYNNNFIPFEFGIAIKKFLGEKLIDRKLINNNIDIIRNLDYTFKGCNLYDIITEYFFSQCEKICFSYLKELNYIKRIIKKYNIHKCIVIDEGDRGRCFVTAGNILGKYTYAIQHGIIVMNSHSYHINSKYQNIVPKKTFLWGERYKNILINNTNVYNEKNLAVVGQIRTQYIEKDKYNKKECKNRGTLNLLFISQYMDDLVKPAGKILFEALKKLDIEYKIIIKLHPGESVYYKYYDKLKRIYELKDVEIVKDRDLYELLQWSDVVISVHSTAILEASFFKKPSICIRTPKYNDVCEFVKDGLSIGINNSCQLVQILKNTEKYFNDQYFSTMESYMNNSFENIGKNITEIIKNIILKD